ncbi:Molecular chaperone (DnaJ superfamily) [Phaffia rhodozyma]|uniref:Molecular chaperone (DnaJ superfamily) n=1 Tax=Phaffia rhodozyma TaxID=264483 RepID=A0A0F7SFS7_PHARH|nr:Molecular chaperone (DnaJ superfamily) [Phaffia rhodozyma]
MSIPNYYAILSVPRTASFEEIKSAYKKESLKSHPDRLAPTASDAERKRATARFQQVADAYFTLSDPARRREYDLHTPSSYSFPSSDPFDGTEESAYSSSSNVPPKESTSSFFSNLFNSATGGPAGHSNADETFTSVFADLLEPEVGRERAGRMWSLVGGAGGAAVGFVIGNIPGAMAGGFAGNRLGAVRDAKGKAVGEVFMSLGSDRKAEILRALAAKFFSSIGQKAF